MNIQMEFLLQSLEVQKRRKEEEWMPGSLEIFNGRCFSTRALVAALTGRRAKKGDHEKCPDEKTPSETYTFIYIYMDVTKNRGTPKWMVYNGKPYKNGWFGGTPIFGHTHIYPKSRSLTHLTYSGVFSNIFCEHVEKYQFWRSFQSLEIVWNVLKLWKLSKGSRNPESKIYCVVSHQQAACTRDTRNIDSILYHGIISLWLNNLEVRSDCVELAWTGTDLNGNPFFACNLRNAFPDIPQWSSRSLHATRSRLEISS